MNQRTEYIKSLIKENNFKSYLEIGLGDGKNFKEIDIETKIGVDPESNGKDIAQMPSDEYFKHNKDKFDLIFIDGLHYADQVEKDIVNSWKWLNKGGMILIHDIKPHTFEMQEVPRKVKEWTGDVWRAWYGLQINYPKLKLDYWDDEYGLGIIYKSRHKIELGFVDYETTFNEYKTKEGWLIKN